MKNSSTYERRFKGLLTKLRKAYAPLPVEVPTDPTEELIWSTLLEDSNEGTAKVGMSRLTGHFVDLNELRVSRPKEVVEALPNTLRDPRGRALRIIRALQAMFDKFDALTLTELRDQSKREARQFLASIPEMTPFVEGRVCLMSLDIHAMPVDQALVNLLRERGVVHPDTDPRDTQGFLERVVPATDALNVSLLLEALRQDPQKVPPGRFRTPRRAKPAARRARTKKKRKPARPRKKAILQKK